MSGVGEAIGGFEALKTAYDLVQDLRKSNDARTLKAGIEELADRLLSARAESLKTFEDYRMADDRANAAEAKLKAALAFNEIEGNYVLRRLYPGAFVYREGTIREADLDPPNYCASCFARKELSIFQPVRGYGGSPVIGHICPTCKTEIAFRPDR